MAMKAKTTVKKRGRPTKNDPVVRAPEVTEVVDFSNLSLSDNHENDRIHLKTGSLLFKQLIECLNKMDLTQVKIEFDVDAIRIREHCENNTIFVVFEKSNFELDYFVSEPVVLKADTKNMSLFMHLISKGCKYELQADDIDNITTLNIITRKPEINTKNRSTYTVKGLNVTMLKRNEIEPVTTEDYPLRLEIDSQYMHQEIKDYGKLSDEIIKITFSDKKLLFEASGSPGKMKFVNDYTEDSSIPSKIDVKTGSFRNSDIAALAGCSSAAKILYLYLDNNKPLVLEYDLANGAKIYAKIPNISDD